VDHDEEVENQKNLEADDNKLQAVKKHKWVTTIPRLVKKSIHERAGELARLGIGRENRREVGMRRVWDLIHNLRDDTPDSGAADATR
jgi:hypothetical protein